MPQPIPSPSEYDNALLWALANPDALADAVTLLNSLRDLRVKLISQPSLAGTNQIKLTEGPDNIILGLPLKFSSEVEAVSAYTGGTANATYLQAEITALKNQVAELTTAMNALLSRLGETGQN